MLGRVLSVLVLVLWATVAVHGEPTTLLSVPDPAGDDFGAGTLAYPLDPTFEPGVFDLTRFSVLQDDQFVYFQFHFRHVSNPWNAPADFYHPRIDVFIDSRSGIGHAQPLRPGPGEIEFDAEHLWDLWVRIAPWDGVHVFSYGDAPDAPGHSDQTYLHLVNDTTIEAIVPRTLVTTLEGASYYVLVGSFDALGIDGYREIRSEPTRWLLSSETSSVRIVDLLAPGRGSRSQIRQLRPHADGVVRIQPVGEGRGWSIWAMAVLGAAILLTAYAFAARRGT